MKHRWTVESKSELPFIDINQIINYCIYCTVPTGHCPLLLWFYLDCLDQSDKDLMFMLYYSFS